jgi:hypothetical protein
MDDPEIFKARQALLAGPFFVRDFIAPVSRRGFHRGTGNVLPDSIIHK